MSRLAGLIGLVLLASGLANSGPAEKTRPESIDGHQPGDFPTQPVGLPSAPAGFGADPGGEFEFRVKFDHPNTPAGDGKLATEEMERELLENSEVFHDGSYKIAIADESTREEEKARALKLARDHAKRIRTATGYAEDGKNHRPSAWGTSTRYPSTFPTPDPTFDAITGEPAPTAAANGPAATPPAFSGRSSTFLSAALASKASSSPTGSQPRVTPSPAQSSTSYPTPRGAATSSPAQSSTPYPTPYPTLFSYPTQYPTPYPTYRTSLSIVEGNCSQSQQCYMCQGHCKNQAECAPGLRCHARPGHVAIPGCNGYGYPGINVCAAPLLIRATECNPSQPCSFCYGDCDSDADCLNGLKCMMRSAKEAVPGCSSGGYYDIAGTNFCYIPDSLVDKGDNGCTVLNPCGDCEGDCDTDLDCEGSRKCYQKSEFGPVPGCGGGPGDSSKYMDFCFSGSAFPTRYPTKYPTKSPTPFPTMYPTQSPSVYTYDVRASAVFDTSTDLCSDANGMSTLYAQIKQAIVLSVSGVRVDDIAVSSTSCSSQSPTVRVPTPKPTAQQPTRGVPTSLTLPTTQPTAQQPTARWTPTARPAKRPGSRLEALPGRRAAVQGTNYLAVTIVVAGRLPLEGQRIEKAMTQSTNTMFSGANGFDSRAFGVPAVDILTMAPVTTAPQTFSPSKLLVKKTGRPTRYPTKYPTPVGAPAIDIPYAYYAIFSYSLTHAYIYFTFSTNKPTCSDLFDPYTFNRLGALHTCHWYYKGSVLSISLKGDATLVAAFREIRINPGVLKRWDLSGGYAADAHNITMYMPRRWIGLSGTIKGPRYVAPCDTITYAVSNLVGVGSRSVATVWEYGKGDVRRGPKLDALKNFLSDQSGSLKTTIYPNQLEDGNHLITVTFTNFLGFSLRLYKYITRSSVFSYPKVSLASSGPMMVYRDSKVMIRSKLDLPSDCSEVVVLDIGCDDNPEEMQRMNAYENGTVYIARCPSSCPAVDTLPSTPNFRHSGLETLQGTTPVDIPYEQGMDALYTFTVMLWIRPDPSHTSIGYSNILYRGNVPYLNYYLLRYSDGQVAAGYNGWPGKFIMDRRYAAAPKGSWTHIAVTYQYNGDFKLYVDGSLSAQSTVAGSYYPYPARDTNSMKIGGALYTYGAFQGMVRDVQVFNSMELSGDQIFNSWKTGRRTVYGCPWSGKKLLTGDSNICNTAIMTGITPGDLFTVSTFDGSGETYGSCTFANISSKTTQSYPYAYRVARYSSSPLREASLLSHQGTSWTSAVPITYASWSQLSRNDSRMDDEEIAEYGHLVESPQNATSAEPIFRQVGSSLAIPANTLIPGKVYGFNLRATTVRGGVTQADGNYTQFVIVEPRPLTTTILGGSKRVLSIVNTTPSVFTFEASPSTDPDFPDQQLYFKWSIVDQTTGETTELDSTTSVASIDSRSLVGDAIYTLYANVSTETFLQSSFSGNYTSRSSSAYRTSQTIVTVSAAVPSVTITPVDIQGSNMYTKTQRVFLKTSVDGPLSNLTYYWSAGSSGNEYNYDDPAQFLYGVNGSNLVIEPNILAEGSFHSFTVYVTDASGNTGSADFDFTINTAPTPGLCSADPTTGYALETEFSLSCNLWTDDDIPLTYQYRVKLPLSDRALCDYQESAIFDTILPSTDSGNTTVVAIIRDALGSEASVDMTVTVSESLITASSAIDSMATRVSQGDITSLSSIVLGATQRLDINNTGGFALNMTASGLFRETVVTLVKEIRDSLSVDTSSANDFDVVDAPLQMISALTTTTEPDQLLQGTRTLAVNILLNSTNSSLNTFTDSIIGDTLTGVANVAGALCRGSNVTNQEKRVLGGKMSSTISTSIGKLTTQIFPGETKGTSAYNGGLEVNVQKASIEKIKGMNVSSQSGGSVRISDSLELSGSFASVSLFDVSDQYLPTPDNSTRMSGIVSATVWQEGEEVTENTASTPYYIFIPMDIGENDTRDDFDCMYYNDSAKEWQYSGLNLTRFQRGKAADGAGIECASYHLTKFSTRQKVSTKFKVGINTFSSSDVTAEAFSFDNPVAAFSFGALLVYMVLLAFAARLDKRAVNDETDHSFWRRSNQAYHFRFKKRSILGWRTRTIWGLRTKHPWFSLFGHHKGDYVNTVKRTSILFCLIFNAMTICALLFGQEQSLPFLSGPLSVAVVTVLLSLPVPFLLIRIFLRKMPKSNEIDLAVVAAAAEAGSSGCLSRAADCVMAVLLEEVVSEGADDVDDDDGDSDDSDDEDGISKLKAQGASAAIVAVMGTVAGGGAIVLGRQRSLKNVLKRRESKRDARVASLSRSRLQSVDELGGPGGESPLRGSLSATPARMSPIVDKPTDSQLIDAEWITNAEFDPAERRKGPVYDPAADRPAPFCGTQVWPNDSRKAKNTDLVWNDIVGIALCNIFVCGCMFILIVLSWMQREHLGNWIGTIFITFLEDMFSRAFLVAMVETLFFFPICTVFCFCCCAGGEETADVAFDKIEMDVVVEQDDNIEIDEFLQVSALNLDGRARKRGLGVGLEVEAIDNEVVSSAEHCRRLLRRKFERGSVPTAILTVLLPRMHPLAQRIASEREGAGARTGVGGHIVTVTLAVDSDGFKLNPDMSVQYVNARSEAAAVGIRKGFKLVAVAGRRVRTPVQALSMMHENSKMEKTVNLTFRMRRYRSVAAPGGPEAGCSRVEIKDEKASEDLALCDSDSTSTDDDIQVKVSGSVHDHVKKHRIVSVETALFTPMNKKRSHRKLPERKMLPSQDFMHLHGSPTQTWTSQPKPPARGPAVGSPMAHRVASDLIFSGGIDSEDDASLMMFDGGDSVQEDEVSQQGNNGGSTRFTASSPRLNLSNLLTKRVDSVAL